MLTILKKIYPKPKNNNYNNLNYDEEGLWSITHPHNADNISRTILDYSNKEDKIIDLTSGCGGNLISFGKYFNNVTGIEINKKRFNILTNNLKSYDYNIHIINDDCMNYLDNLYDIYFIDPPWGGPDYKLNNNLKLYLSNIELEEIIDKINNKLVIIKVPYNYNYIFIKEKYNILKIDNYNNIIIIYFKT
jgi:16S rRNA G966 N2-methylase RsmD